MNKLFDNQMMTNIQATPTNISLWEISQNDLAPMNTPTPFPYWMNYKAPFLARYQFCSFLLFLLDQHHMEFFNLKTFYLLLTLVPFYMYPLLLTPSYQPLQLKPKTFPPS
jgi:hypothetical protein